MPTCTCRSCASSFKSQHAFWKHKHLNGTCRTPAELLQLGMTRDARGRFGTRRQTTAAFNATTSSTSARFAKTTRGLP